MGWKLRINFSDGTSQLVDDDFRTKRDAENEFQEWLDSWAAGAETLELAGRDFDDSSITDCDIWKSKGC